MRYFLLDLDYYNYFCCDIATTFLYKIKGIHPTKTEVVDERCGRRERIVILENSVFSPKLLSLPISIARKFEFRHFLPKICKSIYVVGFANHNEID